MSFVQPASAPPDPTCEGVAAAGDIAVQLIKARRRIVSTSRDAQERIITLDGVVVDQTNVLASRSGFRKKRKAREEERDKKERAQRRTASRMVWWESYRFHIGTGLAKSAEPSKTNRGLEISNSLSPPDLPSVSTEG
jgi:hypothetical protein